MRLFASEKIAGLMDKLGFKEGEVLEHSMLSKSVERAQKKVEENNFGIRKRLLEYDDVMNSQRNVIYTRRRHALMGERIGLDVLNTIYDTSVAIVDQHADGDYEGFKLELFKTFAMECPFTEEEFKNGKATSWPINCSMKRCSCSTPHGTYDSGCQSGDQTSLRTSGCDV